MTGVAPSRLARARALARPIAEEAFAQLRAGGRDQWLTLLGIAWGAAAVVLLIGFGAGFRRVIDLGFAKTGDRYVMARGQFTSQELGGARPGRAIALERDDLELARAGVPSARAVSVDYSETVSARSARRTRTTLVTATTAEMADIQVHRVARGRFLEPDDDRLARPVAVLGGNLAEVFFGDADPLGRTLQLDGHPFDVVGVLAKKGAQFVVNNGLHDDTVFVALGAGQRLFGLGDRVGTLVVEPWRAEDAERVVTELRAVLYARHHVPLADREAIAVLAIQEFVRPMQRVGVGLEVLLGAIGTGILGIAGAGVANLMVASVNRRRAELATRRACGARRGDLLAQLLAETLVVVLAGGALGAALGAGGLFVLGLFPIQDIASPAGLDFGVMATAAGLLGGVGIVAGLTPARLAARVDPAAALRAL